MKVVLKKNIKSIGKKDGMYEVSDGYARNFLFPRKLAVPADAAAGFLLPHRHEWHGGQ